MIFSSGLFYHFYRKKMQYVTQKQNRLFSQKQDLQFHSPSFSIPLISLHPPILFSLVLVMSISISLFLTQKRTYVKSQELLISTKQNLMPDLKLFKLCRNIYISALANYFVTLLEQAQEYYSKDSSCQEFVDITMTQQNPTPTIV